MNANFTKQIIEMSTTEAKAAGKFGSPEFNELQGLRAAFPAFQIVVKAPKKAKNQLKMVITSNLMCFTTPKANSLRH